mmetsp:Transcript_90073/g.232482  ORF Transcript_90073/g.232482 Transcript_90073/m.232482 type:complete len:476 (+) Transcript_90073:76-1503(+)
MGLCALCMEKPPVRDEASNPLTARNKKLRPMLLELERDFCDYAGEDKLLDEAELTNMWVQCAVRKQAKLEPDEEALIRSSAREIFKQLDMDGSGKVSYSEFVVHSMGGQEDRGELRDMRKKINDQLKRDPQKLHKLVSKFREWDKNGDGVVSKEELEQHCMELQQMVEESGSTTHVHALNTARRLKDELLAQADVDNDGKVDLWEAVAWALGRRRKPVEILLYDISKGATHWLGPLLLGRTDVEAFHSAVLVFGSEYWYGGKVFRSDPPCSAQFGEPLRSSKSRKLEFAPSVYKPELMVVKAGYTFVEHDEFVAFIRDKMVDRYTGLEKYDLLSHSCNHFADEVMHFLTGHGVPDHVLELQNMALTPTVKAMRPYLNKYMGGFSQESGGGDQLLADQMARRDSTAEKLNPSEVLGKGDIVVIAGLEGVDTDAPLVATIVKEEGGKCEVKFFDPSTGQIINKTGVPMSCIQRRVQP